MSMSRAFVPYVGMLALAYTINGSEFKWSNLQLAFVKGTYRYECIAVVKVARCTKVTVLF